MDHHNHKLKRLFRGFQLLVNGDFNEFWGQFKRRMYSTTYSLGLRRDITRPVQNPDAEINITIRLLNEDDVIPLLGANEPKKLDSRLLRSQLNTIHSDISNCFVAVNDDDRAVYMQWLIGPAENQKIQETFDGLFPVLKENEALLESAYMNPSFRGLRIMPAAMSRIAEKADDLGVKWVITFVDIENIPSLKGCKRAGFSPYILRKIEWFCFRRNISYSPISEDIYKQYQEVTGSKNESNKESQVSHAEYSQTERS